MASDVIFIGGRFGAVTVDNGGRDYNIAVLDGEPGAGAEASFAGPGVYNVLVDVAAAARFTIVARNGAVVNYRADPALATHPKLVIEDGSTIALAPGAAGPAEICFAGAGGGTLILPPGQTAAVTVSGFAPHDTIDFSAAGHGGLSYLPGPAGEGVLRLLDRDGGVLGGVTLRGDHAQADFMLGEAPDGGAAIRDMACFLRGTMIETPAGQAAVESLRAGDLVTTLDNGVKPVTAARLRAFTAAVDIASPRLRPVRIAAGALAPGIPRRELAVSPDHAIFLQGALVPAQLLVNGLTITQPENAQPIHYVHLEVQPHDIILAEGAPCESYLDIGRNHFARPGVVCLVPPGEPFGWEDACAPLLLGGPALARVTAALMAEALLLNQHGQLSGAA